MNPVLLETITENTSINVGLVIGVVALIVSTIRQATLTSAVAKRLERVVEIHGEKLSAIEKNTGEMALEMKHLAEKQNGSVTRVEFQDLERRVTILEEDADGK